tara:strand:+ start:8865 stop:11468 length:2604 start_codon:yes stop_codon:yes gene_type:complete
MQAHANATDTIRRKVENKRSKLENLATITLLGADVAGTHAESYAEKQDTIQFAEQSNLTYSKEHNLFYGLTPDKKAFRVPFGVIKALEGSPAVLGQKDNILEFFYNKIEANDGSVVYDIKKSYTATQDQYFTEMPNSLKEELIGFDMNQISKSLIMPPIKNKEGQWKEYSYPFNPINFTSEGLTKNNIAYYMDLEGVNLGNMLDFQWGADNNVGVSMIGQQIGDIPNSINASPTLSLQGFQGKFQRLKEKELIDRNVVMSNVKRAFKVYTSGNQEIKVRQEDGSFKPLHEDYKKEGYYQPEDFFNTSEYSSIDEALAAEDIIFPEYFLDQFPEFSENMFDWSADNPYVTIGGDTIGDKFTAIQQMYSDNDELTQNRTHVANLQNLLVRMGLLPQEIDGKNQIDGVWGENTENAYNRAKEIHFGQQAQLDDFITYYDDLSNSGFMPVNFLDMLRSYSNIREAGIDINNPYTFIDQAIVESQAKNKTIMELINSPDQKMLNEEMLLASNILNMDWKDITLATYNSDTAMAQNALKAEIENFENMPDSSKHNMISVVNQDRHLTLQDLLYTQQAYETMMNNGSYADALDFIEIYADIGEHYDDNGILVKNNQRIRVNPWEYHVLKTYGESGPQAKNKAVNTLIEYQKNRFADYNDSMSKKMKDVLVRLGVIKPEDNPKKTWPYRDDTGRIALIDWTNLATNIGKWAPTVGLIASGVSWLVGAGQEAAANRALMKQIESTRESLRGVAQDTVATGYKDINRLKDNYASYIQSTQADFSAQDTTLMDSLDKTQKFSKGLKMDWESTKKDALKALTNQFDDKLKDFRFGFDKQSDQIKSKLHSDISDISSQHATLKLQYDEAAENDEFLEALF